MNETWTDTFSCPKCGAMEEVTTHFDAADMKLAKLGSSHAANTTQRDAKARLDKERSVQFDAVRALHKCIEITKPDSVEVPDVETFVDLTEKE